MSKDQNRLAATQRRLLDELELFVANELVDDRLQGFQLTGVELSPDKAHVTILYLLPDERIGDAADEALEDLEGVFAERAREVLHKNPEIRYRFDRGADNQRRVSSILDELRASGELEPGAGGAAAPSPATDDE